MSGLPEGWEATTLGDVTSQRAEKISPQDQPDLPFIGMDDIEGHTGQLLGQQRTGDFKSSVTRFEVGDILYGRLRPYLNKVWQAEFTGTASAEFIVLPNSYALEQGYLQRMLMGRDFVNFTALVSTGDRPRVSFQSIAGFEFPLPPLAEQRRIVEKLDQISARTRAAKDHLTHVQTLATRAKQTTLAAAFRGELTEDAKSPRPKTKTVTIKDPFTHTQEAPQTWEQFAFSDVCKIVGGSQPAKSNFVYTPHEGYIRLIQIRDYKSDKKATYIPEGLARRFCSETDIMIGRYGPPIFQILRGLRGAYNVALMKAEPTDAVDREFLYWYLRHPTLFQYVEIDSKRTAGQDGVNKAHLQKWPVLLPPLEEQAEIVRRIEAAFARIDQMVAEAAKALALLERLEQQLLAKAFRGELVPQDPNDEPASALLARIREARANAPKPKRTRKKKAAS
ncbi:restriction endonuclease subunit S [Phaeobacter piscinae]|uniref:restriction endonuclease subunit S n=1 Tax=Phaeobacter piscinae TaxID=1580596 RepID=UPI00069384D8|nr:restriction endonuclease subunit S [Phaeobacter piscinae]UTS81866.1 hypothetical protein OL67_002961 [Phaeobacter piscinae]